MQTNHNNVIVRPTNANTIPIAENMDAIVKYLLPPFFLLYKIIQIKEKSKIIVNTIAHKVLSLNFIPISLNLLIFFHNKKLITFLFLPLTSLKL